MSGENKDIEDLLKKFKQFTGSQTPPFFQTKPQYISVLEKELQNPTLKIGEYTEIPFNPINETFSEFIVQYFLAKDKLIDKIYDTTSNFDFLDISPYVRYIDIETVDNILSLVHINTFSVMLIRSNIRIRDLIALMTNDLENYGVDRKYRNVETVLEKDDEIGLVYYIIEVPIFSKKEILSEAVSQKQAIEILDVETDLTKKYYDVRAYTLAGKHGKVLVIPKDEILNYYERVLKDYFKKA